MANFNTYYIDRIDWSFQKIAILGVVFTIISVLNKLLVPKPKFSCTENPSQVSLSTLLLLTFVSGAILGLNFFLFSYDYWILTMLILFMNFGGVFSILLWIQTAVLYKADSKRIKAILEEGGASNITIHKPTFSASSFSWHRVYFVQYENRHSEPKSHACKFDFWKGVVWNVGEEDYSVVL